MLSLLERYKQALSRILKLNLSVYCRLNGVSVSGMHHYIEDVGQSVKSIRDAVLKATEHQNSKRLYRFTADSPHSDIDRADVTIQLSNGTLVSVFHCDAGIITAVLERIKITAYVRPFRINSVLHVFQHPVDMRKGINGLYKLVRSEMKMSPLRAAFSSLWQEPSEIQVACWDTDGFVLTRTPSEKGIIEIPKFDETTEATGCPGRRFLIIQGVSFRSARYRKRFKIEV